MIESLVRPERWLPLLVGLIASLALIGSGIKVPRPQVTASAETTILSFSGASDFFVSDVSSSRLRLSFEGQLFWPDGSEVVVSNGTLLVDPGGDGIGMATVEGFRVPAEANVFVGVDEREGSVRFEVTGPSLSIAIAPPPGSTAIASGDGCDSSACTHGLDGRDPIRIHTVDNSGVQIVIDAPNLAVSFANLVSIDRLAFWGRENVGGAFEKRSGLQAGVLRFLATADTYREFQRGEIISVTPSSMILRSIDYSGSLVRAQFSGHVNDIRAEIGESSYSLRPNLLEMSARIPYIKFGIAFATFVFAAGFSLSNRRWGTSEPRPDDAS